MKNAKCAGEEGSEDLEAEATEKFKNPAKFILEKCYMEEKIVSADGADLFYNDFDNIKLNSLLISNILRLGSELTFHCNEL